MAVALLLLLLSQMGTNSCEFARSSALSPVPEKTPPPKDTLAWVEEVKKGWVMVCDLRDGERWLRALHPRAATSVKLWRLPDVVSRRTEAPYWLEGAPAYILAGNWRTIPFFLRMSKSINPHRSKLKLDLFEERIFIDSTAPCVICISYGVERIERIIRLFRDFWSQHSSFFALLVGERSPKRTLSNKSAIAPISDLSDTGVIQSKQDLDQWERFFFDPFKGQNGSLHCLPGHLKPSEMTAVVGRRFFDLSGKPLKILVLPDLDMRGVTLDLRSYGRPDYTLGPDLRSIFEVARTINSTNTLRTVAKFMLKNGVGVKGFESLKMLVFRTADVATKRLSVEFPLHSLESTWSDDGFYILVPRPGPLPAWSLPFRGLRGNIWGWLAASMVAYAFSWRVITGETWYSSITGTLVVFSTYRSQRATHTPQRMQAASAILVSSLVIGVLYKCRLFTITVEPEYAKPISTLRQLARSGLPLLTRNKHSLDILSTWAQHAPQSDAIAAKAISNSAKNPKEKYWRQKYALALGGGWMGSRRIWAPNSKFVPMRNIRIPDALSLHVSTNWAWRDIFNKRFRWMYDSGLYYKWLHIAYKDSATLVRLLGNKTLSDMNPEIYPRVFTLSDLWPHFQVLLIGNLISTVVFVLELWQKRYYARHRIGDE